MKGWSERENEGGSWRAMHAIDESEVCAMFDLAGLAEALKYLVMEGWASPGSADG